MYAFEGTITTPHYTELSVSFDSTLLKFLYLFFLEVSLMSKCKDCRNFVQDPFNENGKCKIKDDQTFAEYEYCPSFKPKLNEKELFILEISRKKRISSNEYEKYNEERKRVVDELTENGCLTGKGLKRPAYRYVQENVIKQKYPNIF